MTVDAAAIDRTIATLRARLLARRTPAGHWEGCLASSALSTATALVALALDEQVCGRPHRNLLTAGLGWLVANQNRDGGWGDTIVSPSNLSTTILCWAALSYVKRSDSAAQSSVERATHWLAKDAGDMLPERLSAALLAAYGKDRTFSVPILTVLALTGKLGAANEGWKLVPQLPFELAACPQRWFEWLQLPVVSYALPALVAIGQVRHHHRPTRVFPLAKVRSALGPKTLTVAHRMQPSSGGYLEATPLTSFVVMSLIAAARGDHPIVERGVRFLQTSAREDGSWPIDTNLATWVTTLSIDALNGTETLEHADAAGIRRWLLDQQTRDEHAFTRARPGGWAWTDLSGGVPDADDTAGALLAIATLASDDAVDPARAGIDWLLDLQNRDGGIPTFCRGWGAQPFDRSAPDLTAHALRAWAQWYPAMEPPRQRRIEAAGHKAGAYLRRSQRQDGSWIPLWFGNEQMPDCTNPTYGTARVLDALSSPLVSQWANASQAQERAVVWLLRAQNEDGGWGAGGTCSTIEETGIALHALAQNAQIRGSSAAMDRGARWLVDATEEGRHTPPAPIGLYFARLWYYEELYPLIFALRGLSSARRTLMVPRPT